MVNISINQNVAQSGEIVPTTQTSVAISKYTELTATTQPKNGKCASSPPSGVAVVDTFNLSCYSWQNGNTDSNATSRLEYTFIFDFTLFLKEYNSISSVSTVLTDSGAGFANVTAVILEC